MIELQFWPQTQFISLKVINHNKFAYFRNRSVTVDHWIVHGQLLPDVDGLGVPVWSGRPKRLEQLQPFLHSTSRWHLHRGRMFPVS